MNKQTELERLKALSDAAWAERMTIDPERKSNSAFADYEAAWAAAKEARMAGGAL